MITKEQKSQLLKNMIESLELPESAYQKAKDRYENIGEWFGRDESLCKENDPHIFPQGSFRLGTAIRPLDEKEEYDLDLACKLRTGISQDTHTQQSLKALVGLEIKAYRKKRGIMAPVEEKHRCWRLEYQDDLSFHMDIVPCIPADNSRKHLVLESMMNAGASEYIAGAASQSTVSITDDRHDDYQRVSDDWGISNPEGYAKWFEEKMRQQTMRATLEKAQVDDIPLFKQKTPLQQAIQLLKRHRDQMFKDDDDTKPISIIITTLATRAYQGESDIESALSNILATMGNYVHPHVPRVPNPVDPEEDFADRWAMPQYSHLKLEDHFDRWLRQAQVDFDLIGSSDKINFITEQAEQKFAVRLSNSDLSEHLGLGHVTVSFATPKSHAITEPPAKPWRISGR